MVFWTLQRQFPVTELRYSTNISVFIFQHQLACLYLIVLVFFSCLPIPVSTHFCCSMLWSCQLSGWDFLFLWRHLLLSSCFLQAAGVVNPFFVPFSEFISFLLQFLDLSGFWNAVSDSSQLSVSFVVFFFLYLFIWRIFVLWGFF